jgi:hypothetical protein
MAAASSRWAASCCPSCHQRKTGKRTIYEQLLRRPIPQRYESPHGQREAPHGYRNVRVDGRSLVEIDPQQAAKVRRVFELYAHRNHTLDSLSAALWAEGVICLGVTMLDAATSNGFWRSDRKAGVLADPEPRR